ncbi:putative cytosolic iron-sulfur protein assembly protein Ciao1 [Dissostichus eleginoides]|uniref:Cytosolic iron-sulfur protein assembly protein Ciao1 n=1 Tax=Dissostichus eleginoides TaxID=100907 RepID=A0AAD9FCU9_DISEL|nr:putative cytosolic iron-sulfur protein assembly protein Ciao1 [Dissostichus eleginoides]
MAAHAEEAAAKERERLALRVFRVGLSAPPLEERGGGGVPGWFGKRKADQPLECLASSSSQREVVKMSNLGLGMDELQRARYIFSRFHPQPALGVLTPDQRERWAGHGGRRSGGP